MSIRIALIAVGLVTTGSAQAAGPQAQPSSLQGQTPWEFLTAPSSASRCEVPATWSVTRQLRRAVERTSR